MCVYIDPHALIENGQLEKSTNQYSVVPARRDTSILEAGDDVGTSSDTEEDYDGAST